MKFIAQTVIAISLLIFALTLSESTMALEEPDYEVIEANDGFELRRYAPYLVAETKVEGSFRSSGNQAFRILAGYIFGGNDSGEKMAMTAPVVSTLEEDQEAPHTYQFVMESAYDLNTLPTPNNEKVEIVSLPERLVAAHRFSGRWSEGRVREHLEQLLTALDDAGLTPVQEPMLARYNPPFTPWFMRRNEILVEVARRSPVVDQTEIPGP